MTVTPFSAAHIRVLIIVISTIQLLDILLHAATNQLEPLRVTSNVIILIWLTLMLFGKLDARFFPGAIIAVGLYLVLNTLFLAREGVTNAAQGGGLRVTMLVLVFLTVALTALLTFLHPKRLSN